MSILTHSPTELTDQQKLNLKAESIKRTAKVRFSQLCDIQKSGINVLWKDREHTPQQIIDALGPDAIKIFQMHGILTDAIKQIAAIDGITPTIALPTNDFEILKGNIIVSDNPYTAQL